jgi:hypothetical protein
MTSRSLRMNYGPAIERILGVYLSPSLYSRTVIYEEMNIAFGRRDGKKVSRRQRKVLCNHATINDRVSSRMTSRDSLNCRLTYINMNSSSRCDMRSVAQLMRFWVDLLTKFARYNSSKVMQNYARIFTIGHEVGFECMTSCMFSSKLFIFIAL